MADAWIDEPITKAKWLTDKCLLVTTSYGNLYSVHMSLDDQGVECLSRPNCIWTAEHEVALWDIAALNMSESLVAWVAEDSGKVTQISFESTDS